MYKPNVLHASCFIVVLMLITGCSGTYVTKPIYSQQGFLLEEVQQISLLLPVDSRFDKKENIDLKKIQGKCSDMIKKKGYQVLEVPINQGVKIDEDDLKSQNQIFIKNICAAGTSRYVMLVNILDVSTRLTFGSTGNAEVSGYIFDKDSGVAIWHHKGIGQVGQGGLLGILMKSSMDNEAVMVALHNLFSSIPLQKDFKKNK